MNSLVSGELSTLFANYIHAFSMMNMQAVRDCYLLPCTLNTPDKVVLLNGEQCFQDEFKQIFDLLASENIVAFKVSNATFDEVTENTTVAAVDWQFLDNANNLFTEFTAIYHLTKSNTNFKIINVVSQDISQSITLSQPLIIEQEMK
jgi:hypothetical protein